MGSAAEDLLERAVEMKKGGDLESARAEAKKAVSSFTLDLAGAIRLLAEIERGIPDHNSSVDNYERAVELLRGLGGSDKFAHTIRHLGDVYYENARINDARKCYTEALDVYRRSSTASKLDIANAIRSSAVLESEAGAKDKAIGLWQEARSIYESLGIEEGVEECESSLSSLLPDQIQQ